MQAMTRLRALTRDHRATEALTRPLPPCCALPTTSHYWAKSAHPSPTRYHVCLQAAPPLTSGKRQGDPLHLHDAPRAQQIIPVQRLACAVVACPSHRPCHSSQPLPPRSARHPGRQQTQWGRPRTPFDAVGKTSRGRVLGPIRRPIRPLERSRH